MPSLLSRFLALFSRERLDRDLEEEIGAHLEMATEENIRRGMSVEDARSAARRRFGGVEQVKEAYRDQRGLPALDSFLQDIRFAFRSLRRYPSFYLTVILTLAVGIGSTTAIFSVVDRLLFRSLPYPDDDRLVSVGIVATFEPNEFMMGGFYSEWKQDQKPFEAVTSSSGISECDLTEENPLRLSCARVEWDFLPTLGIVPLAGRNFSPEEDRPEARHVALVSFGLWQSRFGGDPGVVGKDISLDGRTTRIIGILPRGFELPTLQEADLLVPQALPQRAGTRILRVFARLKPAVTLEQAQSQLQQVFEDWLDSIPPMFRQDVRPQVRSLRDRQVQDARTASWFLLASVVVVLLIACANVANLLLARAAHRQHELAMRAILGAGRGRLLRQSFLESLLLALMGGAAGYGLAFLLLYLFRGIAPQGIARLEQASLDMRVMIFALGTSLLAAILFGTAPALRNPQPTVLSRSRAAGPTGGLFRKCLVAGQLAASLMLLTAAGVLMQSLWNQQNEPLGMENQGIVMAQIALGEARYSEPGQARFFFEELETRLRHLPGVDALSVSDTIPPAGMTRARPLAVINVDGRKPFEEGTPGMVGWRNVTAGYFDVLRIPITRGRNFHEPDRDPGANAIILSERLSELLFPNEDPIGQRVRFLPEGPWLDVIGVAEDVKNAGLESRPDPEYYLVRKHLPDFGLANQVPGDALRRATVAVRTSLHPEVISDWVRAEIAGLDPTLPITIQTMRERVSRLSERARFNASLLSFFAAVALLMAAIGLYGVISFLVNERTREIGVRMALGATYADIRKFVLFRTIAWTGTGIVLGIGGSILVRRASSTMLFGVAENDPFAAVTAVVILVSVALLAAWFPSRRAARLDPMAALRCD